MPHWSQPCSVLPARSLRRSCSQLSEIAPGPPESGAFSRPFCGIRAKVRGYVDQLKLNMKKSYKIFIYIFRNIDWQNHITYIHSLSSYLFFINTIQNKKYEECNEMERYIKN